MVFALIFLSRMASGNRVDVYMMVNKYWFPNIVLVKGPTQSTIPGLKVLQTLELVVEVWMESTDMVCLPSDKHGTTCKTQKHPFVT